ncbi:xylose import ATP-binding protein XylG [mine drainage metagenome]|uniref:Xylose import ATP-binding protein XylG n=1 Tax=mine drainage metagenome TaxID=410659 RepID=A0A1J5QD09_9ZZZZ
MSLELRGITKRFGALTANDSISLKVEAGEIHALLGENGAGKSTLMNVVYGLLEPDSGEILMDGKPLRITGPSDALAAGIGMVHQHFMLVNVFTVAENIMLGNEHVKGFGFLDLDAAREEIRRVSSEYGLEVDPDAVIEELPVGIQQRVEILRALIHHAKVLILDEPTAVLTPQETDELLTIMHNLADAGTAIVFITHKLREVQEAADRITVIRLGKVVGQALPTDSQEQLATMMVGRPVSLTVDKGPAKPGEVILAIENLTVRDATGRALVSDVSFQIRAGEILAVAGVQGNGQSELAEAMIGLQEFVEGSIKIDGEELVGASVHKSLHSGIAYVPESREVDGLVGSFSIAENLVLDLHDMAPYASGIRMFPAKVREDAVSRIAEFDVRTTGVDATASSLSGGNKQKVVLARELSRPVKLVIASQPTRGLDVGSIEFVHKRIIAERDAGRAVFISSTELDEVLGLADRIAVMYRGKIIAIVPPDTSRAQLGLLMAGITESTPETQAS